MEKKKVGGGEGRPSREPRGGASHNKGEPGEEKKIARLTRGRSLASHCEDEAHEASNQSRVARPVAQLRAQ